MIPRSWTAGWRAAAAAAIVAAILVATSGLVWLLEEGLGLTDASATYLLAVTAAAVLFGTWMAIAAAVAAFGLYNFLFTHPLFTFIVADTSQLLNLVLLLVVGVVVGQLAGAQRGRAEAAEVGRREAVALFQVSRALANRQDTASAIAVIVDILGRHIAAQRVWVGLGSSPGHERPVAGEGFARPEAPLVHAVLQRRPGDEPARWMRVHPPGPPGRADVAQAFAYRVPIAAAGSTLGAIWVVRAPRSGDPQREETRLLAAAADQVGQALEQDRLRADATRAELARRSEAMKSALLESVSHDLRTPLAAIRASAGALLEGTGADEDALRESGQIIDDEAARMDRLVANLLDMSRIDSGEVAIDLQPWALGDLLEPSLRRRATQREDAAVGMEVGADLPYVLADAILMDQVITNLLDNALHYAPGAPVRISAAAADGTVRLVVEDGGPGVPPEAVSRLFDKFYRVPAPGRAARRGTGLGLAVVRGLVEAMGGRAEATPSPLGGLAVTLTLRAAAAPPEEE